MNENLDKYKAHFFYTPENLSKIISNIEHKFSIL